MKKVLRWLPVIAWMGVIFLGSSIPSLPRVGGPALDGLVHRVSHLLEFAVLGMLVVHALSLGRPVTWRDVIVTLIVVALYGASDEFHQRFTPGRNSEGLSVLFDVAGGVLGVWVYCRWKIRHQIARRPERGVPMPADSTGETRSDRAFD